MKGPVVSAFDSLDARAHAAAGEDPADRISLRDHIVEAEIGAFQHERGRRQRISFDVVVEVLPSALDDDVDHILSYDTIVEAIAAELERERINLLETLAERIAARLLAEPRAERVYLRIQKLDLGPGALGVEIVRSVPRLSAPVAPALPLPRPVLILLGNAAIDSGRLGGWLDAIEAAAVPVILTVDLPESPRPRAASAAAQRRIDLLAIEQNAWRLAGRDRRCVVVDSRTELEWGLRHGQISVWAPARLALDSPARPPADPSALLIWLAGEIGAKRLVGVGAPIAAGAAGAAGKGGADLPLRILDPGVESIV